MGSDTLVFNGIDAATGEYLLPPMSAEELSRTVRGARSEMSTNPSEDPVQQELQWRRRQTTERQFAPEEGVDPKDLAQAGWGVIFPARAGDSLRGHLTELLDHRKAQAGPLYREFMHENGYRPGDTKRGFLARHGASSGWVKPALMPYYLLIVGSPEDIPYLFQYELDVQHAVGRIWFDTPEEYAHYAHSVVTSEQQPARAKTAAFAGVRNVGDGATELSATQLIAPLASHVTADQPAWQITTRLAADTTKSALLPLMGGSDTPALLFTASHGVGFAPDHPLQLRHQGALLCQDWPGPGNHRGPIPADFYISADDIGRDASLLGLIAFHFACYGAGTPQADDYSHAMPHQERNVLASKPFVAQLPKRMLGHENGGALATIGHIDRAWGYSFRSDGGQQLTSFESMLKRLMEGHPVGSAMEAFNSYFGEVATELSSVVEAAIWAKPETIDNLEIAGLWTRHNDARAYAIVGDPAVRLNVSTNGSREANPYIVLAGDSEVSGGGASTAPSGGATRHSTMVQSRSSAKAGVTDMANQNQWCFAWFAGRQDAAGATRAALVTRAKWEPGQAISIAFLDGIPSVQERVREVAAIWTKPGLANLSLEFRNDPAEALIRISFEHAGSWSMLGTTCQTETDPSRPTMNFGWLDESTSDDALRRVVLHEFGHALGLIHEHQNPGGLIPWNRDAVYESLSGPPNNWSKEVIDRNMFQPWDERETNFTRLDPDSIMMYPIPAAWTDGSFTVGLNDELSDNDREFISAVYG